jgi:thioredoxin 1
MVVEITTENFEKEIKQSELPVVLDAYAPWCGPCKAMAPIFEEIEKELGSSYKFAKMNVDDARDIAIEFQILTLPTFLFIKNGEVVDRVMGSTTKNSMTEKINSVLG